MGFEQVFENLTCKRMGSGEEGSVYRRLCFTLLFLDICNVKHILTMILRIELL